MLSYGRLGLESEQTYGDAVGTMGDHLPFVSLGTGRVPKAITADYYHTCVLLSTNQVACWGLGLRGGLATGSSAPIGNAPGTMGDALVLSKFGGDVQEVVAGLDRTCVVLTPEYGSVVKCVVRGPRRRTRRTSPSARRRSHD